MRGLGFTRYDETALFARKDHRVDPQLVPLHLPDDLRLGFGAQGLGEQEKSRKGGADGRIKCVPVPGSRRPRIQWSSFSMVLFLFLG